MTLSFFRLGFCLIFIISILSCRNKLRKLSNFEILGLIESSTEPLHDSISFIDPGGCEIDYDDLRNKYMDTSLYGFDYYVDRNDVLRRVNIRPLKSRDIELYSDIRKRNARRIGSTRKVVTVNCDHLSSDLTDIFQADQSYRRTGVGNHDDYNLEYVINALNDCVDTVSFVNIDRFDMEVIWLVIQHSNPQMRKKYFGLFMRASEFDLVSKGAIATMYDRIRIDHGKCQYFGTQVGAQDDEPLKLYPVCDSASLKYLRDSVGLGDINSYLRRWGLTFTSSEFYLRR